MAEKWDAIIVGAGIGGLACGAALSKGGKKVLMLESRNGIGGRAYSLNIMDIRTELGFHGIVNNGHMVKLLKAVGQDIPMVKMDPNFVIYHDGKFFEVPSKISDFAKFDYVPQQDRKELMEILQEIHDTPIEAAEEYDFMGWGDWIKQRTKSRAVYDFVALFANVPITEEYTSHISAGEALRNVGSALREGLWAVYPKIGAMNVVHEAFAKVVTNGGGKLACNMRVREIYVKNDAVTGVVAESPEGIVRAEAPVVISNLPIWNIFHLINQEHFPRWFYERVHFLEQHAQVAPGACIGITCVSNQSLHNYKTSVLLPSTDALNTAGPSYVRWLSQPTNWVPSLAEKGKFIFQYGPITPRYSYDLLRERPSIYEKETEGLWREVCTMFPKFDRKDVMWKGNGLITAHDLTMKIPGNTWKSRIDVKAPNIDGLYFVGDTVRGWGIAMDSAVCSAIICAEKILKKKVL